MQDGVWSIHKIVLNHCENQSSVFFIIFIQLCYRTQLKNIKHSVKHKSTSDTVHCYMFRFLRNHHKTILTKYLKHINYLTVTKNTKKSCDSNILCELPSNGCLRNETCRHAVCHLLYWVLFDWTVCTVVLFTLLLAVTQRN